MYNMKIDQSKISKEFLKKTSIKDNTFIKVAKDNPKDKIDVEIGDSKTKDKFLPQQKIMRWDNEVNCSVRLVHNEKNPVVTTKDDKIVWEGEKIKAEIYQFTEDEGGQEFEITLKEKPKSNVVQFTVVDKGVDYFYQPALTEEEIAKGASRPDNVVGSYAVYASEQKTNYVGGKEYKTGKIGHIFRPKIIDSAGTEVWGDLHIENGILSVTIPQDFLDNAVYPVRHAAGLTFGYTTKGASNSTQSNTYQSRAIIYNTYTANSGDYISGYSMYGHSNTGTKYAAVVAYTVNNSNPDVRLTTISQIGFSTSDGLRTISGLNQTLSNGVQYCLGFSGEINSTGYFYYWYDDSGGTVFNSKNTTLTNPFNINNSFTRVISIYATYTAGGASTSIKSINGLAIASVKSVNGLAIASIKSINGLSNVS